MANNQPLVSICIPTFNRVDKLQRAINAILKGSYQNIQIIISDNASCDNTFDVCTRLSELHNNIYYYRHDKNLGPKFNFEYARNMASGKYFMWHSDDDYLDGDYIKECVNELENDQNLIVVSGLGAYYTDEGDLDHYGNIIECKSNSALLRIIKYVWMVGENSIFYGLYRREKVRDLEIENMLATDWAWMVGVIDRGKSKIIKSVYINREFQATQSSSVRKMVETLSLPRWNIWFPWTATYLNIASYIRKNSIHYQGNLTYKKIYELIIIFFILFLKCSIMNIAMYASRIYVLKLIYRIIFKKIIKYINLINKL